MNSAARCLFGCVLLLIGSNRLTAQSAAQPEALPAAPGKVAAVVNGASIMEAEVAGAVRRQLRGQPAKADMTKRLRDEAIQFLIDGRLMDQFLQSKKIVADPSQLKAVIQNIKGNVAAQGASFDDLLKQQGTSEAAFRQRIAGQLAFEKYAEGQLTDQRMQDYFAAHKARFDGTEVQASHLLLKLAPTDGPDRRDAALAKIQSIRQEIIDGLDFAAAAQKYSEGPSGPKGGELGYFAHDRMVPPFAAAAFAMKKGEISGPVETQFGLHLIQVTGRKPGTKTLDKVQDSVKRAAGQSLWGEMVAELRKTAKIEFSGQPAPQG